MKITFNKNDFDKALTPALGCVGGKNTVATIEGILITAETGASECRICSYDLEKGYRTTFDAEVKEGGSYIINAQKLSAIIRAFPEGSVNIDIDDKNLVKIYSGKSVFELAALDGSTFPAMPVLDGDRMFTIRCGDLKTMINQTIFAIAQNDSRPALNGAYFKIAGDRILVVSCDGNRMALRENTVELGDVVAGYDVADDGTVTVNETGILNCEFIVPGKTLVELLRHIGSDDDKLMRIQLTSKHVVFSLADERKNAENADSKENENGKDDPSERAVFFSRLIDSEYIDYNRFIPKANKTFVTVDREKMLAGLEMAALFSEDRSMGQGRTGVSLVFEAGVLRISSAASSGRFVDEIPLDMEGDDIELGFNCRFLIDALRACDTNAVRLSMSSPIMSIVIEAPEAEQSPDRRFLMLVVPMKPIKK